MRETRGGKQRDKSVKIIEMAPKLQAAKMDPSFEKAAEGSYGYEKKQQLSGS